MVMFKKKQDKIMGAHPCSVCPLPVAMVFRGASGMWLSTCSPGYNTSSSSPSLNWSSSTFLLPYKLENDSVEQNVPGFKIK
jgi:hypothetical protein